MSRCWKRQNHHPPSRSTLLLGVANIQRSRLTWGSLHEQLSISSAGSVLQRIVGSVYTSASCREAVAHYLLTTTKTTPCCEAQPYVLIGNEEWSWDRGLADAFACGWLGWISSHADGIDRGGYDDKAHGCPCGRTRTRLPQWMRAGSQKARELRIAPNIHPYLCRRYARLGRGEAGQRQ